MKAIEQQVAEFFEKHGDIYCVDDTELGEDKFVDVTNYTKDSLIETLQERDRIAREEEREACAVAIWNEWAEYPDKMEDNEINNAYSNACKVIRGRKALTTPDTTNDF
jgi:hypothetical protein